MGDTRLVAKSLQLPGWKKIYADQSLAQLSLGPPVSKSLHWNGFDTALGQVFPGIPYLRSRCAMAVCDALGCAGNQHDLVVESVVHGNLG